MATPSLPVPVEVLETVLRFVPVNENFRLDQPANQDVLPVSRDRAFNSVRINKFWRLQFAYKQWMEIVQLHLGEFELKMSASSDPAQEVGDSEAAIIWNEFVAFNLDREINGIKGLDHLTWSYLNCYVASVKLFYHIPPAIGSALCAARLARTLKQIAGFFVGQPFRLHVRLLIDEDDNCSNYLTFPVPPVVAALEIPPNISFDSLSVAGVGPYVGLLQSLLLAGQASLKSLSANALVLLPALEAMRSLILPGVALLSLPSSGRQLSYAGLIPAPADPLACLANAFPNLTTLQLPPPEMPSAFPAAVLPGPPQAAAIGRGRGRGAHRLAYQPRPGFPGPLGPGGMIAAGVPMPGAVDLRPLVLLRGIAALEMAWPALPTKSILNIEHEQLHTLHLRLGQGSVGAPFTAANCLLWLKVAAGLETLELSGLGHYELSLFAAQIDTLSATVDFSKVRTVRLAIAKSYGGGGNDDAYAATSIGAAFAKFNLHFTALRSISLKLKADEVPSNFSRFVLENVPERTRHFRLVNVFQNRAAAKPWKTWIFNIVANVAISLSHVDHVEIESSPECFPEVHREGLAEVCQELANDARLASFDFGGYATMLLEPASISRLRISKRAWVADTHVTSVRSNYELQFFLKRTAGSAEYSHEGSEQQISFLFTAAESTKFNPFSAIEVSTSDRKTMQEYVRRLRDARTQDAQHQIISELRQNPALYQQFLRMREASQQAQAGASSQSAASASGPSSASGHQLATPRQTQPPVLRLRVSSPAHVFSSVPPSASGTAPHVLQHPIGAASTDGQPSHPQAQQLAPGASGSASSQQPLPQSDSRAQ